LYELDRLEGFRGETKRLGRTGSNTRLGSGGLIFVAWENSKRRDEEGESKKFGSCPLTGFSVHQNPTPDMKEREMHENKGKPKRRRCKPCRKTGMPEVQYTEKRNNRVVERTENGN